MDVSFPYVDLKRTFKSAIHMRKAKKIRVFSEILLTFLVACTRLYTPLCPSVGWSVGRSVGLSPFYFFGVFERFKLTAPTQMPQ